MQLVTISVNAYNVNSQSKLLIVVSGRRRGFHDTFYFCVDDYFNSSVMSDPMPLLLEKYIFSFF